MIQAAKKWVGYLEHQSNDLLGIYTANVGKGGCTIFSEIVQKHYYWRNFSGMPWCAVFIHAICIETYGVDNARKLLGRPHPGSRVLARRMRRKGWLMDKHYVPKTNDLIFLHNGDGEISHVGIVEVLDGDTVVTIEGNTIDSSGHFPASMGGAVARRRRSLTDEAIVNSAKIYIEGG